MQMTAQYLFKSSLFQIEPGEEEETNPECYGKALARWMRRKLQERGLKIDEDIIPEDWGWLVMVARTPFALWVGCGSRKADDLRHVENEWAVFAAAEQSLIQRLFKRVNIAPALAELEHHVVAILSSEAGITNIQKE